MHRNELNWGQLGLLLLWYTQMYQKLSKVWQGQVYFFVTAEFKRSSARILWFPWMALTIKVLVLPKTIRMAIKSVLRASALLDSPSSTLSHFRLGSMTLWSYSVTLPCLNRRSSRNYRNFQIPHGCYTQKIKLKIRKLLLPIGRWSHRDFLHARSEMYV